MSDNVNTRLLEEAVSREVKKSLHGGGGSSDNGDMWQQSVETRLNQLRDDVKDHRNATDRDFRILFGAIIAACLGLAWLMAQGFRWL